MSPGLTGPKVGLLPASRGLSSPSEAHSVRPCPWVWTEPQLNTDEGGPPKPTPWPVLSAAWRATLVVLSITQFEMIFILSQIFNFYP